MSANCWTKSPDSSQYRKGELENKKDNLYGNHVFDFFELQDCCVFGKYRYTL